MRTRTLVVLALAMLITGCDGSRIEDAGPGSGAMDLAGDLATGDASGDAPRIADADSADLSTPEISDDTEDATPDVFTCDLGVAGFGCPCLYNTDCASGHCVDHLGERVCSVECAGSCPEEGYTCHQVGIFCPPCVHLCVSEMSHLCRPCRDDADCEGLAGQQDVCVDYGPEVGRFCGGDCETDGDCPEGFLCQTAKGADGGTSLQCVHETGICPCGEVAGILELSTVCAVTGEEGTCWGIRACGPEGLSACDAAPPGPELCFNGLDDDCDGVVDDPSLCEACVCGDGLCMPEPCGEQWDLEEKTCAPDCAVCGNDICDPGEGPILCAQDCCGACGDGICKGGLCGEGPATCVQDCEFYACGNGICEPGENPVDCVVDCMPYACGNKTCEPGEDPESCPEDCAASCGDCSCDSGESYDTCPVDCGFCGDGYCISKCAYIPENLEICPMDCCVDNCGEMECGPDGCDDGLPCTSDACVAGVCENALSPVYCLIDGGCVPSGTLDPMNVCAWCWPLEDPAAWSPRMDGLPCAADAFCVGGVCDCQPDCAGKDCGSDGCGGSCGECPDGISCDAGVCPCIPDCSNECGPDGCGGSCGDCPEGEVCNPGGQCKPCTPDCEGKACGEDDGCWGSCDDWPNCP